MEAYKINLIIAILGILTLFVIGEHMRFEELNITKIDSQAGHDIVLSGTIKDTKVMGKRTILTICNKTNIQVVVFNPSFNLTKGTYVQIKGKVQDYEGSLNIIAYEIKEI